MKCTEMHVDVAVENSIALHYSIALTQLHYLTLLHSLATHTHTQGKASCKSARLGRNKQARTDWHMYI